MHTTRAQNTNILWSTDGQSMPAQQTIRREYPTFVIFCMADKNAQWGLQKTECPGRKCQETRAVASTREQAYKGQPLRFHCSIQLPIHALLSSMPIQQQQLKPRVSSSKLSILHMPRVVYLVYRHIIIFFVLFCWVYRDNPTYKISIRIIIHICIHICYRGTLFYRKLTYLTYLLR